MKDIFMHQLAWVTSFFVIDGFSNVDAEVFDSTSRKFTFQNLKILCRNEFPWEWKTVNICRNMFVLFLL